MEELSSEAQAYVDTFRKSWQRGVNRTALLSIAERHYPKEAWHFIRHHYTDIREDREAARDVKWWDEKLKQRAAIKNPTLRWRECMGMRHNLLNHCAVPRPWVVEQLDALIAEAEAQGADTDPTRAHNLTEDLIKAAKLHVKRPN